MTSEGIRRMRHMVRLDRLWMVAAVFAVLTAFGAWTDVDAAPSSFDEIAESAEPASPPSDDRVIARVSGMHGRVYAESPDGTRRLLVTDAPIYPGDRLVTARGAQLGVLSGDHYTGLNEDTELSYALTPGGAPEVRLVRGHVRVLESGDESAPANVSTPSLQVAQVGGDVEVYAFPEKAYLVSMVCALEGQVRAASIAGESATVAAGGCAVLKPAEGIYAAGAAGGIPAPILAAVSAGPPTSPAGPAAARFSSPDDVAGPMLAMGVGQAPSFDYDKTLWAPCQTGATAGGCAAAAGTNPPTIPPVPGPLPPFPTNPPTIPPVPGPLPPFPVP